MTAPTESQEPPEILDDLDAPTLRAVRTYIEQRLDDVRLSLEERIRSEADGEIVDIEDWEAYTLVRKYPPSRANSENSSQPHSLYRVKREKRLNGEETLHWSFSETLPNNRVSCVGTAVHSWTPTDRRRNLRCQFVKP